MTIRSKQHEKGQGDLKNGGGQSNKQKKGHKKNKKMKRNIPCYSLKKTAVMAEQRAGLLHHLCDDVQHET